MLPPNMEHLPRILLSLPMAYQDGLDKYDGVVRFLKERGIRWDIRLDRQSVAQDHLRPYRLANFQGIIADDPTPALARAIARTDIPLVAVDWGCPALLRGRRRWAAVEADSVAIGKLSARTALDVDRYASYAYLPAYDGAIWSTTRGEAFAKALAGHRLQVIRLDIRAALAPQLRKLPKPALVFVANDMTAVPLLETAKSSGIAVPDDLSVLGVDNERLTCQRTDPPLASIQPDFVTGGARAAEALSDLLADRRTAKRRTYHVKTVVRRESLGLTGPSGRLVQRAKELIQSLPLDEFGTINDLAQRLRISRRLLDRRFRQIEGRSVLEVIQERKLGEICNLLRNSTLSIGAICESCYPNAGTYPLRLFKRRFGLTMRDWRNAKGWDSDARNESNGSSFNAPSAKRTPSQAM